MKPIRPSIAVSYAVALIALFAQLFAAQAANLDWLGGTASYNTPADWFGGAVPGLADSAINDNGSNNVVEINPGDPAWTLNQIMAGDVAGNGAFTQNGQTVTLNGTNKNGAVTTGFLVPFRLGVGAAYTGIYTLNGGTNIYVNGPFNVGEIGTAILNLNGGLITGTNNFSDNLGVITTPNAVNATAGNGLTEADYTWFEQGYCATNSTAGLPAAGATITSVSQSDHSFTLPPSYTNNNVVLIETDAPNAAISLPAVPVPCTGLSFLCNAGNAGSNPVNVNYTVQHADGTTETGSLAIPDWFASAPTGANEVLGVGARVDALGVAFQYPANTSPNTGNAPYLWSMDIAITNTTSAVTNVALTYVSGGEVATFMAVSSQTTSGGAFTPVAMGGYNADVVVEADAQSYVSGSVTDIVNQTSGAIEITGPGQMFVGNYGNAIYNQSGGSIDVHNYIAIGRSGGNGTFNLTGGTLNQDGGGNLLVGTGFNAPSGGSAVGVLNQNGGTINCLGSLLCPEEPPATGTYNLTNGTLICSNWIAIGRGAVGTLNMAGGLIVKNDTGSDHFDIGAGGSTSGTGPGTVNQTGGTITNTTTDVWMGEVSDATWNMNGGTNYLANIVLGYGSGLTATLNLSGGQMTVQSINSKAGDASLSTLNFNGGLLQASVSTPTFITNLSSAYLQENGAVIDSQGYTITIPQVLSDGNGGGLTKLGTGTLFLTGANTYVGPTVVSNGTLYTTTASSGAGAVTVSDGAAFGVAVASAGTQYSVPAATVGNVSGASLDFNLGSFGDPTVAPLGVTGALTAAGTITVNISASVIAVGTIPLVQYGSLSGSPVFVKGSLPGGVQGTLTTNGTLLALVVTSAGAPRWEGDVTDSWDLGSNLDWFDLGTLTPTIFRNQEPVVFDDNASNSTVNLTATVSPGSITFNNNVLPYAIVGSGTISGLTTGLTLNGTNTVAILNTGGNNFSNPVVINGGTLTITNLANGGSPSAIGASSASPTNLVLNGGTLDYEGPAVAINRGYNMTASSTISNNGNLTLTGLAQATAGTYTKSGAGTLDFAGAGKNVLSVASGGWSAVVQNGTLVLDGSAGGQTNTVGGDMYAGAGTTSGAATGLAGNLIVSNATLNCTAWFAISRGNCTNGLTSTVTLYNSTLNSPSGFSLGYANGLANYSANPVLNLYGNSLVNAGNNNINICETANGGANALVNVMGSSAIIGGTTYVGADTSRGVLNINSTATSYFGNNSGGLFRVGGNAAVGDTGAGAINLSAGTLISGSNNVYLALGVGGTNCYGSINVSGGYFARPTYGIRVGRGGFASFVQSGGTLNIGAEFSLESSPGLTGVNGDPAVATFTGGSATVASGFRVPEGGSGFSATLNIGTEAGGSAAVASSFATAGVQLTYASGGTGTLNLNNGTLEVNAPITKTVATGVATVDLNGGTLQAGANNVTLLDSTWVGASSNSVNVFKGGVTIDSQTNTATIAAKLSATAGNGVYPLGGFITVPTNGGAGYIGAPIVTNATSGAGTGLQAVATVSNGVVTNVVIVCPGQNYAIGDTVTFGFAGGGSTTAASTYTYTLKAGDVAANAGGGLTKIGSGTLFLNGVNAYTGTTLVNGGILAGSGTIAGPVTVASGGTLVAGASLTALATNTIAGAVTFQAGGTSFMKVNKTSGGKDMLTGASQVNYGGTLVVSNLAGSFANGDSFKLYNAAAYSGAFSAIVPATPGSGLVWNTNQLDVSGTLLVTVPSRPHAGFTAVTAAGGSLVISGTNAVGTYVLYSSTNLTTPIANWTPVYTNTFSGPFSFTNSMNAGSKFYLLK
jgi:autotransporter-associated beta strand protein